MGERINNSEIIKKVRELSGISALTGKLPSELAEKIIPVIEVNPELQRKVFIRESNLITTSAGSAVIFTTSAGRDFYLCGFSIKLSRDAACDLASIYLEWKDDDNVARDFTIPLVTLVAGSTDIVTVNFEKPIKVKKSQQIGIFAGAKTAGVYGARGSIWGYEVDQSLLTYS